MRPTRCLTLLVCLPFLVACGNEIDFSNETSNSTATGGKPDSAGQIGQADDDLRLLLAAADVSSLDPGIVLPMDDPMVVLGQALFFDRILSGNRDIACATCHHPSLGTSDAQPLSIGVGGGGLGESRLIGEGRNRIPRNAPDVFNRGSAEWTTMFWDNRVASQAGAIYSPAGADLPPALDSVLAVQAMFPPTSADEMRGEPGENEVADAPDNPGVWSALTARVVAIEEYRALLGQAFPDVAVEEIGFHHLATAIAAFEVTAFTRLDSPFDRYLEGDDEALSAEEKYGAWLFFGEAACASCHNGPLLTDQQAHVIASPQCGPGKSSEERLDLGRFLETEADEDRYAFRTPPLRGVEVTGPYFHSGAYATLEAAVRHHLDPVQSLLEYDAQAQLPEGMEAAVMDDLEFITDVLERVDPDLAPDRTLADADVDALVAFLRALSDESIFDMDEVVPQWVPSGLPVDGVEPAAVSGE